MDLDELEMYARDAAAATAKVHAATHARERYDANEAARAAWEDLGECGEDVVALIARVRAAEAERDRLLALFDEAYPRALQAAADVVVRADVTVAYIDPDESEVLEWIDNLANDILELSADEIDAFAEQQEQAHRAESGEQ